MYPIKKDLQIVSLDDVKKRLRIDDESYDGELLQIVAEAEQEALQFVDRTPESLVEEYGSIPADFVGAILIRVSTRFENRGEFTQKAVNPIVANTWENILMKYVNPQSL